MTFDAYTASRRREARQLLHVANRAVQLGEPRPWAMPASAVTFAKVERAQEKRIARVEGRAPAAGPRVVMRLDADVATWLEEQRRPSEGVYEGNSRIIRELRAQLEQRDAYIAGLEEELAS